MYAHGTIPCRYPVSVLILIYCGEIQLAASSRGAIIIHQKTLVFCPTFAVINGMSTTGTFQGLNANVSALVVSTCVNAGTFLSLDYIYSFISTTSHVVQSLSPDALRDQQSNLVAALKISIFFRVIIVFSLIASSQESIT